MSAALTSSGPAVGISLLGPLEVRVDGHVVELTAEKERILVAALAMSGGEGMSVVSLIDELWDAPTASSKGTLQTYVSNVRKLLAPGGSAPAPIVELVGERYRFAPETVVVDALAFRSQLARVRELLAQAEPDRAAALAQVTDALARVRGPFDPSLVKATGALAIEAARSRDETLEARWIWADLEIQAGRAAGVVSELRAIVDDDPTEERFWRQLMLAYWKTGRQQMALDAYQQVRRVLAEELGVLPDPSLQDLEQAILRHDPQLGQPIESAAGPAAPAAPTGPPASTSRRAGNIAPTLNSFVGRAGEVERIRTLLADHPLVTLRGAGGCGKTRLAREVAREVQDRFAGGAWWVEFGELAEGDASPRAQTVDSIATAVGLIRRSQGSLDDALIEELGDSTTLLVLDNCEHLVDDVADVVALLLRSCPNLKLLATTREALRVVGEVIVAIEPLGAEGDADADVSPAARLFFDRADPVDRVLEQDPESRRIVNEICIRLDGVPLALELAAALVETTPLAEILAELSEHRFELLTTGQRGAARHHQTLEAVVDWSYDRLDPAQRELYTSVSMFPGSFSVGAAAAVAGLGELDTRRLINDLVRKSIVDTVGSGRGVERYRLLETLRAYGLRQLATQDRAHDVEQRFISYFVDVAAHSSYDPTTSVIEWFERLGPDIPNLRLAIRRAMETGSIDEALSMINSFHWYYNYVGSLAGTERWLRQIVGGQGEGETAVGPVAFSGEQLVMAYTSLASLANLRGSYRETSEWADRAVETAREHGDVQQRIAALVVRGATAVFENRQEIALEALAESLELSTELGDRWGRAVALTFMAVGARRRADELRRADPSSAWMARMVEIGQQFERAYELFSQVGDDRGMALVLINLGRIEEHKGDFGRAVALCDRGMLLAENVGDSMVSGLARVFRGRMAVELGNDEYAVECFTRALMYCDSLERHRVLFSSAAEWLGIVAARHGDIEPLLRIASATEVYREAPRTAAALPELHAERDRARVELGPDRSDELESDGRLMKPDAVKALAIRAASAAVGVTIDEQAGPSRRPRRDLR